MSTILQNIVFGITILAFAFFGYQVLFMDEDPLAETQENGESAAAYSREFLTRLNQLEKMQIDKSIFTDARFESLVDYREDVPPQEVGRTNPFSLIDE